MQAKDIPNPLILDLIRRESMNRDMGDWEWSGHLPRPVFTRDIQALLPGIPPKVVRAKLSKLVRQGLIDGCCCGCRGDFVLKEE